jgi:hypothetical protein
MNVEIGTKAAQFPEKECINGIFLAVTVLVAWPFWSPPPLLESNPPLNSFLHGILCVQAGGGEEDSERGGG